MLSRSTSVGILPTHCVASVWKITSRSWHSLPISGTSLMVPISLLAHMMLTRMVSGRMAAFTMAAVMMPSALGSRKVTSKPSRCSRLQGSSTALCSCTAVMMWPRLG